MADTARLYFCRHSGPAQIDQTGSNSAKEAMKAASTTSADPLQQWLLDLLPSRNFIHELHLAGRAAAIVIDLDDTLASALTGVAEMTFDIGARQKTAVNQLKTFGIWQEPFGTRPRRKWRARRAANMSIRSRGCTIAVVSVWSPAPSATQSSQKAALYEGVVRRVG